MISTSAKVLILASALVLIFANAFAISFVSAAASGSGFVTYSITVAGGGMMVKNYLVNETVSPSSFHGGFEIVTLELFSSQANLTYSREVNASALPSLFPYFPSLGNRSFSYSTRNYTISVAVSNSSPGSASFDGKNYSLSNYAIWLSLILPNGSSYSTTGRVSVLPSDLIYSVSITRNETTLEAKLVATDLPLLPPSGDQTTTGLAMVGVSASAALAFVIPWRIRKQRGNEKKKSEKEAAERPSYWVD